MSSSSQHATSMFGELVAVDSGVAERPSKGLGADTADDGSLHDHVDEAGLEQFQLDLLVASLRCYSQRSLEYLVSF